jgi:hypothetical protein
MTRVERLSRRTELRFSTEESVTATVLGNPDIRLPCHVRNVSKSGMCIMVAEPIESGRAVKIDWSTHFLLGRVRRVSRSGVDFRVGLELLYCSKWNEPMSTIFEILQ